MKISLNWKQQKSKEIPKSVKRQRINSVLIQTNMKINVSLRRRHHHHHRCCQQNTSFEWVLLGIAISNRSHKMSWSVSVFVDRNYPVVVGGCVVFVSAQFNHRKFGFYVCSMCEKTMYVHLLFITVDTEVLSIRYFVNVWKFDGRTKNNIIIWETIVLYHVQIQLKNAVCAPEATHL